MVPEPHRLESGRIAARVRESPGDGWFGSWRKRLAVGGRVGDADRLPASWYGRAVGHGSLTMRRYQLPVDAQPPITSKRSRLATTETISDPTPESTPVDAKHLYQRRGLLERAVTGATDVMLVSR